ncbi:DUF6086 family protein [Streptomyces sp. NBC_00249]|uniref:DUF6086 family protein n=2 Tax=Streptomyces sp. NBC_00249 TaxID=2975690 RepID=UPI002B1D60C7|nr:DUF6086 family protein [Streptomyces sp. NBC_00249]
MRIKMPKRRVRRLIRSLAGPQQHPDFLDPSEERPLSYPFETENRTKTIWDPALRVGQIYVSIAHSAGHLLGLPTGVTPNERGGADVDIQTFQAFTQRVYDTCCSTNNFIMHDLMRGMLLASIVMLENGGGTITRTPEREAGLLDSHDLYRRGMWAED